MVNSNSTHYLIFYFSIILLVLFMGYVFFAPHLIPINNYWKTKFTQAGLTNIQTNKLSHDDDMWFYDGISTCVCYGDYSKGKCIGKDVNSQIQAVVQAVTHDGGEHRLCPMFYYGTL